MTDRQFILDAVQNMPDQASLEDILDELALLASVKRGQAQIARGEGIPHEEVVRQVAAWNITSSGHPKP